VTSTHGRTDAPTHGALPGRPRRLSLRSWLRASVPLCVCASVLTCTDPRARVAPPTIQVLVSPNLQVKSPGAIPASVYCYDFQGFDSLHVSLRSPAAALNGDSLYLFPDTTEATTGVVWDVPSGVPAGTKITLVAKVWNVVGFAASDSVVLTSQ